MDYKRIIRDGYGKLAEYLISFVEKNDYSLDQNGNVIKDKE